MKKQAEEILPLGVTVVDVKPTPEFGQDKKPIPGTHKKGVGKYGAWYMYSANYDGQYVDLFANDENKDLFDSGKVGVSVYVSRDGSKKKTIVPSNDITALPQNQPREEIPLPEPPPDLKKAVDWDKVNWNKCKTLFAVQAYAQGKKLDDQTRQECEEWADYCMKEERSGEYIQLDDLTF